MKLNAAGLVVAGAANPNWRGGMLDKVCAQCGKSYRVIRSQEKSRYCSLKCVGLSQRGRNLPSKGSRLTCKECETCSNPYFIPTSAAHKWHCCSKTCSHIRRKALMAGECNPNWTGGVSRLPYPWNFREISKRVIARDGCRCMNPGCRGTDRRLTTHHVNYDKQDCRDENLLTLCSACNSSANFGREKWQTFYTPIAAAAAMTVEVFE